jgi:hypothetical protein
MNFYSFFLRALFLTILMGTGEGLYATHLRAGEITLTRVSCTSAVFTYPTGGERNSYIDWDGRDDNGREVAAGVYYYIAQVTFNSVDPGQQHKSLKGWVQVVR